MPGPLRSELRQHGLDDVEGPKEVGLDAAPNLLRGAFLDRADQSVAGVVDHHIEGTESGDGRHSNVKRELSGVFHAMTGANGKIKTGQIMDVGAEGIDVYNTVLEAMGAPQRLGPANRDGRAIDAIRA